MAPPPPGGLRPDANAAVDAWPQQLQPWQATSEVVYDPEWSAAKTGIYSMLAPRRG